MPKCDPNNQALYSALAEAVKITEPKTYLEVGTREGDSLLHVIGLAKDLKSIVYCDPFVMLSGGTGRGNNEHIKKLLADSGFIGGATWLKDDSKTALRYHNFGKDFDLILIDGDHSFETVRADALNCWRLLRVGGCMVFDDIGHGDYPTVSGVIAGLIAAAGGAAVEVLRIKEGSGAAVIQKISDRKIYNVEDIMPNKQAILIIGPECSGAEEISARFQSLGFKPYSAKGFPSKPGQEKIIITEILPNRKQHVFILKEIEELLFACYNVHIFIANREQGALACDLYEKKFEPSPEAAEDSSRRSYFMMAHIYAWLVEMKPAHVKTNIFCYESSVFDGAAYWGRLLAGFGQQEKESEKKTTRKGATKNADNQMAD